MGGLVDNIDVQLCAQTQPFLVHLLILGNDSEKFNRGRVLLPVERAAANRGV